MLVKETEYFTTSETSQRFDLIRHLIENSEIVPLVRGPSGIGKTLLATRLQQLAPDNWSVCLIDANATLSPEQLLATIARCSGWTDLRDDLLQGLVRRFEAMREQGLVPVILIDQAHHLQPTGLITLLRLFERQRAGEPLVSIVLFADEQIDMLLSTPQLRIMTPQSIQVIDLQPLSRQEATSFMHFLLQVEGLSADLELDSSKMTKLYKKTKGVPGLLRQEIVNEIGKGGGGNAVADVNVRQLIYWVLPILILIGGVLLYQDSINQLFEDPETHQVQLSDRRQPPLDLLEKIDRDRMPNEASEAEPTKQLGQQTEEERTEEVSFVEDDIGSTNLSEAEFAAESELPAEDTEAPPDMLVVAEEAPVAEDVLLPEFDPERDEPPSPILAAVQEPVAHTVPIVTEPETDVVQQRAETAVQQTIDEAAGPLLEQAITENKQPIDPLLKEAWVKTRPPERYTIQLLGVESLVSLKKFVTRHALKDEVFYIKTRRNGKPWYPLLWGEFPDKLSAISAQQTLPAAVRRNGVWARTFGELQELPK